MRLTKVIVRNASEHIDSDKIGAITWNIEHGDYCKIMRYVNITFSPAKDVLGASVLHVSKDVKCLNWFDEVMSYSLAQVSNVDDGYLENIEKYTTTNSSNYLDYAVAVARVSSERRQPNERNNARKTMIQPQNGPRSYAHSLTFGDYTTLTNKRK